jgi:hypothetical protein
MPVWYLHASYSRDEVSSEPTHILIETARSHLSFRGPYHRPIDEIAREVEADNAFANRWHSEWTAYYCELLISRNRVDPSSASVGVQPGDYLLEICKFP